MMEEWAMNFVVAQGGVFFSPKLLTREKKPFFFFGSETNFARLSDEELETILSVGEASPSETIRSPANQMPVASRFKMNPDFGLEFDAVAEFEEPEDVAMSRPESQHPNTAFALSLVRFTF